MSRLASRLKGRLSEIAHRVLVWCLLHDAGMRHKRIGGHANRARCLCPQRGGRACLRIRGDHLPLEASPLDQDPRLAAPWTVGERLVDA